MGSPLKGFSPNRLLAAVGHGGDEPAIGFTLFILIFDFRELARDFKQECVCANVARSTSTFVRHAATALILLQLLSGCYGSSSSAAARSCSPRAEGITIKNPTHGSNQMQMNLQ